MKILPSLFCFLFFGVLFSCKKKSDPEPDQQAKKNLLTASPWKIEDAGFDVNRDGNIEIPALSALPDCVTDNTISFKTDNTGTTDEGSQKCNSSDPQTTPFNWSFADGEANISVSNSVLTEINGKSKIVTLTATSLSLAKDTTIFGTSGWAIVKLKH